MITKEIPASVRDTFGKGAMRRLRSTGKTPGVVYSQGEQALPLQFETKVLYRQLLDIQGRNAVITLKIDDGSERNALVKEIQTDPVKDTLYHTDFQEIDLKQPATFTVPITFTGKSKGVELGGRLNISIQELLLEGIPLIIPDECLVDVSDLDIGDSITAGDIKLPDGVTLITEGDKVCISVAAS